MQARLGERKEKGQQRENEKTKMFALHTIDHVLITSLGALEAQPGSLLLQQPSRQ
jgi:hypothetical protein